jgi:hypothetical protein
MTMRPRCFALVVSLVACGQTATTSTCPNGVVVVTTDEQAASGSGVLPLDGTPALVLGASGADPALATSAGRRFFVARDQDTIYELDSCGQTNPSKFFSARAMGETGPVDPQDVAVGPGGELWIARWNVPSVLVEGGGATPNVVDLSAFDSDGNPDIASVAIVGGQAFVALDRLTAQSGGFVSQQTSQVAVLDTTTFQLVQTITLKGRDPLGTMKEAGGKLWLADAASPDLSTPGDPHGGIEAVDPTALTSSMLISADTLGASVVEVAIGDACGAAIVADGTPNVNRTSLISFSLDGTNVATALGPTDGFDLRGLAWSAGTLLVGDKRPSGSGYPVHVFSATPPSCALAEGADLTLPELPALAFAP